MDIPQLAHFFVKFLNSSGLGAEKSKFIAETFFEVGSPMGQAIVFLIMALFAVALVILGFNFCRMSRQYQWLKQVKLRFESLSAPMEPSDGEAETVGGEANENDMERRKKKFDKNLTQNRDILTKGIPRQSIIAKRIDNLYKIRSVGDLTCDSIKEIVSTGEIERTGLLRYLAGIFIVLGLVGTVIGLSQSVVNMQPVLTKLKEVSDLIEVSKAITETLTGMRTAFSATISGLVATILLSFLNFVYGNYATRFLNRLEDFTTVSLIPHFLVSSTEDAAIQFANTMTQSAEALNKSSNPLREMTERFDTCLGKLENVMDKLNSVGTLYNTATRYLIVEKKNLIIEKKNLHQQQEKSKVQANDLEKPLAKALEDFNQGILGLLTGAGSIKDACVLAITANRSDLEKLLHTQRSHHEEVIKKQNEVASRYEQLLKMEKDKVDGIIKIYDLSSLVFDKTSQEAAVNKQNKLIDTMQNLGVSMKELISELYVRSQLTGGNAKGSK